MKKSIKKSSRRKWVVGGVAFFGSIALLTTGFATWVVGVNDNDESNTVNVKVETTENASVSFTMTYASESADNTITIDEPDNYSFEGKKIINPGEGESKFDFTVTFESVDITIGHGAQEKNGYDGIEFASAMIELKGVGKNEERALANALKRLSADNKAVVEMIKSASIKIIDYYNAKGMALLAQAETLAATGNYEEALYILLTIPSECNVYTEAIEKAQAIYQKYSDNKCTQLLSEAEAAWAANPTPENAEAVVSKLTGISPDASNYAQVQAFINKVGNAVKSEIEYERKKEDEAIAYERQKEQQALERRHQMELQALKAARDVAKAYAENQPDINYHIW